ncbi:hypothetical protein RCL1_008098 [Eukaryota sp. TZLM3-RCL]
MGNIPLVSTKTSALKETLPIFPTCLELVLFHIFDSSYPNSSTTFLLGTDVLTLVFKFASISQNFKSFSLSAFQHYITSKSPSTFFPPSHSLKSFSSHLALFSSSFPISFPFISNVSYLYLSKLSLHQLFFLFSAHELPLLTDLTLDYCQVNSTCSFLPPNVSNKLNKLSLLHCASLGNEITFNQNFKSVREISVEYFESISPRGDEFFVINFENFQKLERLSFIPSSFPAAAYGLQFLENLRSIFLSSISLIDGFHRNCRVQYCKLTSVQVQILELLFTQYEVFETCKFELHHCHINVDLWLKYFQERVIVFVTSARMMDSCNFDRQSFSLNSIENFKLSVHDDSQVFFDCSDCFRLYDLELGFISTLKLDLPIELYCRKLTLSFVDYDCSTRLLAVCPYLNYLKLISINSNNPDPHVKFPFKYLSFLYLRYSYKILNCFAEVPRLLHFSVQDTDIRSIRNLNKKYATFKNFKVSDSGSVSQRKSALSFVEYVRK